MQTVSPERIAAAMAQVSALAGLPEPDLTGQDVTGRDLRLFLADVIEHVRATGQQDLIDALDIGSFPVGDGGPGRSTWLVGPRVGTCAP